jgi:Domain of unknown function (DUF4381)
MIRMEGKITTLELVDPSLPGPLIPEPAVSSWWIGAAAAGVLALALLLWMLRRRSNQAENPATIREAAFKEARAALAEITTSDFRTAAIQCSLVLRHYLAKACGDPALFETHEEFIARHDSLKGLGEDARIAAKSGFERLVVLKYSPQPPQVPAAGVCAACRQLLETLYRGFGS